MDGEFALYPNHARIVSALLNLGLTALPDILWRKPTNAPNKFMGSGMLPGGAYVTYEHEYVLIFRKAGKRSFTPEEKVRRAESAYFWEERNVWFSDLWTDLRGTGQRLKRDGLRERSAAFPFELPYRLIQMYSMMGDTVLDPFAGTGVTAMAALASGRDSVSVERVEALAPVLQESLLTGVAVGQRRSRERLDQHRAFIAARAADGRETAHRNTAYGFPVITRQEVSLRLTVPRAATVEGEGRVRCEHDWLEQVAGEAAPAEQPSKTTRDPAAKIQTLLF